MAQENLRRVEILDRAQSWPITVRGTVERVDCSVEVIKIEGGENESDTGMDR